MKKLTDLSHLSSELLQHSVLNLECTHVCNSLLLQDVPEKDEQLISLALKVAANPVLAVVMLGGGHFAAGIFQGLPKL
jgi:hypothetical protein